MASFNEHYTTNRNAFRQQAEESYNQAAAANRSATDQYLADIDAIYKENARQLEHAYEQQKAQLPQDYQYAYDKNAIQQAINEREVAGRMEQLGLTDSGLNRTQQAAINVQRSNADQAVTQQQNAQLNALSSALAEQLSQNRANQTAGAAQARYDLAARNQDLYNSYMSNADSMAASIASNLYSADQQRAAAEAQAAAEQRQAYYDYLLESQKAQSQNGGASMDDIRNMASDIYANGESGISYADAWNQALGLLGTMPGGGSSNGGITISSGYNDVYEHVKNLMDNSAPIPLPADGDASDILKSTVAKGKRIAAEQQIYDYLTEKVASGEITEAEADRIIVSVGLA